MQISFRTILFDNYLSNIKKNWENFQFLIVKKNQKNNNKGLATKCRFIMKILKQQQQQQQQ